MKIALIIKENGDFWLVHDEPFDHSPAWGEYDPDQKHIVLVSANGATETISIPLSKTSKDRLLKAKIVFLVYMKDGKRLSSMKEIPITIQNHL